MLDPKMFITLAWLLQWQSVVVFAVQQYPEASLDQATFETKLSLDIARLEGLNDAGLQAEHEWTSKMAILCLENPETLWSEPTANLAIEFQRHAGRTARYRGLSEQALRDYDTALDYIEVTRRLLDGTNLPFSPARTKLVIMRDIADTLTSVGAYEVAEALTELIEELALQFEDDRGSPVEVSRLGRITEREGRIAECVQLRERLVRLKHFSVSEILDHHPTLDHVDRSKPWAEIIRRSDVQAVLRAEQDPNKTMMNEVGAACCDLSRALRFAGRLDEAEYALETARLMPWTPGGGRRERLDLWVDRECAFLAFAKGEPGEALGKAEQCLDEYVMSAAEEIELLDLVSRAKEALGDLGGAMEALEAAIEIVETRRANLVADEFKQSYAAGYAELYRRALDLSLLRNADFGLRNGREPEAIPTEYESPATSHETPATSDASRFTNDEGRPAGTPAATAFQWAERLKGRAMLDAINRYDQRMERAIAGGHTEKMKIARRQMREVISLQEVRAAKWLPDDTALLEFAYGSDSPRSTQRAQREGERREIRNAEFGMRNMGPRQQEARSLKPEAHPADHESRTTSHGPPVYLWLVRKDGASFHRLGVSGAELDRLCSLLSGALTGRGAGTVGRDAGRYGSGDAWVEPAATLYEHTIRPIVDRLRGIKQLVIVGDGKLRTVPFEVFISSPNANERRYIKHRLLIEDYAISYAPSATTLQAISAKTERGDSGYTDSLWAFASTKFGSANVETEGSRSRGVEESSEALHPKPEARSLKLEARRPTPEARPANHEPRITGFRDILRAARSITLDDLPNTKREVERIVSLFPQGSTEKWIDEENMKQVLLSASDEGTLKSVRFLHFATHAFVDESRPYLCGLVLSPPFPNATDAEPRSLTRPSGRSPPSLTSACQGRARCAGGGVSRISPRGSSAGENARHGEGPRPGAPGKLTAREESGSSANRALRDAEAQRPAQATLDRLLRRSPSDGTRPELLTLHELAGLDLRSELVVLSACQSLGGRAIEGDWINGLARSFLIAGSSGVLCTLWETGDKVSSTVVPAIYHAILDTESAPGKSDVPRALQQHKISTLNSRQHGHPSHWAAFIYHGRV